MKNGVMFQSFEWEMDDDGKFYVNLKELAPKLKELGFDSIWLPPVYKATGTNDVGYGVYDLYDLGEFDQKGAVRTKYGTKEELLDLIKELHNEEIAVYLDVVLNHKAGADRTEKFMVTKVNPENRTQEISEPYEIEGWTAFDFPGRGDKYSDFKWNYQHFSGVDYDQSRNESGIFRIEGENKGWSFGVSGEKGNFDYLMNADIDHSRKDVQEELLKWTDWIINETGADGFRMDAVKHIDDQFIQMYSKYIEDNYPDLYLFAEFWEGGIEKAERFMERTNYNVDIFDVPLHFNLLNASQNDNYDLRTIFDNTIVKEHPLEAVTFVDNHDSQPGQSLESWIGRHFKERAYALILLRKDGYPCIFAGDYYGIKNGPAPQEDLSYDINRLLELRSNYAYGDQTNFFQDAQAIGWTRNGDQEHPGLLATVITMHSDASIHMSFGSEKAGTKFIDYLDRHRNEVITLDENGEADFPANAGSVSCWISKMPEELQDKDTKLKDLSERKENL